MADLMGVRVRRRVVDAADDLAVVLDALGARRSLLSRLVKKHGLNARERGIIAELMEHNFPHERDADKVLGDLQHHASDEQAQMIEDLAVKAGYWWKCGCDFTNSTDDAACAGCGAARGKHGDDE